jgi:hypothetical protein
MPIKIIDRPIVRSELQDLELKGKHGSLVKAVVDIERAIIVAGVAMHSDAEEQLLENGSKQNDLWGINLYLQESNDEWIEFDSMINLRPSQGNCSRGIEDPAICQKIRDIVNVLVK